MTGRWVGPLVAALILGGVALVLFLNLEPSRPRGIANAAPGWADEKGPPPAQPGAKADRASFREYPIGDEVERNHMRIAAVWLPPVDVAGMPAMAGPDVIHLEADVHATAGNPNGFGKDAFVPYLKIRYAIVPRDGGRPLEGELAPMVARDGEHYGASIGLPKPGPYRLTYKIEPPSANGMGLHRDPVTGVAPWWEPFEVEFDWDYPGPSGVAADDPARKSDRAS